ncbi:hypothetical protein, partial [Stenoxybacter acetivorans]|uniref:hypothetical protein n=1 Tax=Stenoxybacter acetivorans TaxID=422441 RepID=UPI00146FF1EE
MNIQNLSQYALLAQASYAYLENFKDKNGDYKESIVQDALIDVDRGSFASNQAENFVKNYEVISHQPNTSSGFSATILRNKESNENIFSIRGTELSSLGVVINDGAADFGDIGFDGIAIEQAIDLFNYLQRLTAVKGQKVLQLSHSKITVEDDEHITYQEGIFFDKIITAEENGVLANQMFSIVGHSLGGHLAMILSRLAGDFVTQTITVNAPGFDTEIVPGFDNAETFFTEVRILMQEYGFSDSQIKAQYNTDNMTHLVTESNLANDVISKIGTVPGEQTPVYVEIGSALAGDLTAHSSVLLSDALALQAVFSKLDRSFDLTQAYQIFQASGLPESQMLDALRFIILGDSVAKTKADDRENFYKNLYELEKAIDEIPSKDSMYFQITNSTIAAQNTAEGFAHRYALAKLNAFALVIGADYSHDTSGELDLYDTATGEITENWLNDRNQLLIVKSVLDKHDLSYQHVGDHSYGGYNDYLKGYPEMRQFIGKNIKMMDTSSGLSVEL